VAGLLAVLLVLLLVLLLGCRLLLAVLARGCRSRQQQCGRAAGMLPQ
jgi:hypothetical protein